MNFVVFIIVVVMAVFDVGKKCLAQTFGRVDGGHTVGPRHHERHRHKNTGLEFEKVVRNAVQQTNACTPGFARHIDDL